MWLWRRRRRQLPPPLLLPSLDRLAELIDRVVALLDDVTLAPEPARGDRIGSSQHDPEPTVDGWVAFAHAPEGYRLLPQEGSSPTPNATVELEGCRFVVLRLGPSPLPGDRRRCAFLERQEPSGPERTFDR